jgi:porin
MISGMFVPSYGQKKMNSDSLFVRKDLDTVAVGASKSGYDDIVVSGGSNSVGSNLKDDDKKKSAWIRKDYAKKVFDDYYDFKRYLNKKIHLALGIDYTFLNQFATYSASDIQASSGVFRFYGTWQAPVKNKSNNGAFIFKIENRHGIGPGVTPRNLGYEAGAALSTATFKDFGWGLTNFYWKQYLYNRKIGIVFGIMDPGDWLDLYPLLNPFTFYLNEAFFNSPAMAIPNQGLGMAVAFKEIFKKFYVSGGIHDANGEPFNFIVDNVKSFFQVNEYLYWVEAGWDMGDNFVEGESIHLMYWYQDPREAQEVSESWGLSFSASKVFLEKYKVFMRAGFSEGNGARMRHIIMTGMSIPVFVHDLIGVGLNYGGPNDRSRPNQLGMELFYRLQLGEHLSITPDIQLTINPSFNDEKDVVGIFSVFRIRYAL